MNTNVEYRVHATYWDKKPMDYATKVLTPDILSDIILLN